MCGFAGFINYCNLNKNSVRSVALKMANSIQHRGPDDCGVWQDDSCQCALAHRRLSILDLSSAGHQPMVSRRGLSVIAYNGEIYNHSSLRHQLESSGYSWHGSSDTESLLASIETWGLEMALKKSVGMFALAFLDLDKRFLYLARDRMGEKPLYYGMQKGVFMFGSELKALKAHPAFEGEVDREALSLFMKRSYIPSPFSIYKGIRKLPPGSFLKISLDRPASYQDPVPYWEVPEKITVSEIGEIDSPQVAIDRLEAHLAEAVRGQMLSDVPLGAFLSGGIDSSAIVAMMQSQSSSPVKTFSIGFHESEYDEAVHAKRVAEHLGTEHTECYLSGKQAMEIIPQLPRIYDEPFGDVSQIPTLLVSQLARSQVSVALSGDGGDELFCGYNRYHFAKKFWKLLALIPFGLRRQVGNLVKLSQPNVLNPLLAWLNRVLPHRHRLANPSEKVRKTANAMSAVNGLNLYDAMTSHWLIEDDVVLGRGNNCSSEQKDHGDLNPTDCLVSRLMLKDIRGYLPDDILCKVDRAAMSVSLETRVPFLNHELVEFASSLPLSLKFREGKGKWLLRQVLYKYVPQAIIERPKMGFSVPIGDWIRGPMKDWAEDLLDNHRLNQEGYLNANSIHTKWEQHLNGKANWQEQIWDVLMFQSWLEEQKAA